jgi:GH25 family lysozyme M1 (1,4-beta-N-acetylmuramidase)
MKDWRAKMDNWMRHAALLAAFTCLGAGVARSQSDLQRDVTQREARRAFATPEERAARTEAERGGFLLKPYVLTDAVRKEFPGTFGIDVSHYDFDKFNSGKAPSQCTTQMGYDDTFCSCTLDWTKIKNSGIDFAYLKASDGAGIDLSLSRNWKVLQAEHEAGRIYRGAYHFLRFKDDVNDQAAAFLKAIGATNGVQPQQLSPALDMEPIPSGVIQAGSELDRACPQNRRGENSEGQPVCDMWYTIPAAQIVKMAETWISVVEHATGLPVTIYTTQSWWNEAIGDAGDDTLLKKRPIWIARYTDDNKKRGPAYVSSWNGSGQKWGMPPLPGAASYPAAAYTDPNFWQWTEESRISTPFPCNQENGGDTDLNWVPLTGENFRTIFGVNQVAHK